MEYPEWANSLTLNQKDEVTMLWWALAFFVLAIIAAFFGFGGIATALSSIAQIIFFIALVFFVIALLVYLFRGASSSVSTA